MSDIDPEKLAKSITWARHIALCGHDTDNLTTLANAAERTLNSLPRLKEVEVVRWGIFDQDGAYWTSCGTEAEANEEVAAQYERLSVVRLTGTAKVKAKP